MPFHRSQRLEFSDLPEAGLPASKGNGIQPQACRLLRPVYLSSRG